jgi:hypothetical protein
LGAKSSFSNNADYYDLQLGNWDINSDWTLKRKYNSIICTRVLYFCKDPVKFFAKCHQYLNSGGKLFVDFGLGHHWSRFKNFKVGWVKDGEHEWEYKEGNFLWSTLWDDSFLLNKEVQLFQHRIAKFGYDNDLGSIIKKEVPAVIGINDITRFFSLKIHFKCLWEDMPQLYIFLDCVKSNEIQ